MSYSTGLNERLDPVESNEDRRHREGERVELLPVRFQNLAMFVRWLLPMVLMGAFATLSANEFNELQSRYRERRLSIDIEAREALAALLGKYADAVAKARDEIQASGDLASTIAATREIDAARSGVLAEIDEGSGIPERLASLRRVAEEQNSKIASDRDDAIEKLNGIYVSELEKIVPALTRAGDLERALAAREEIERLTRPKPEDNSGPRNWDSVPKELQDDLVVWFPLDEPDETIVTGIGPEEFTGFVTGTEFVEEGRVRGCRSFDGDGDRIALSQQLPDSEKFTVALWVKYSGIPGAGGLFSDYDGRNANDLMFALIDPSNAHLRADKGGDKFREEVELSSEVDTDWHHLVWVLDSNGSDLYMDGKVVATASGDGSNEGNHKAFIGYANDGSQWSWFRGELDEFFYWNRDLSAEEVARLWEWTSK